MKTVLSVLCWIGIAVMLNGCDDGDDGGSAGGYGEFPEVSYVINDDTVVCYNADKNVRTGSQQICTWNCANYHNKGAVRKVTLYFDEDLVCTETADSSNSQSLNIDGSQTSSSSNSTGSDPTSSTDSSTSTTTSGTAENSTTTTCVEEFTLVKEDFDPCVL